MNKNYTELTVCAINAANALCTFSKKYPKIEDLETMKQAAAEALTVKERMQDNRMIDKCLRIYITTAMENKLSGITDADLPTTVYGACRELVLFAKKWDTPPSTDEAWEDCINQVNALYKIFNGLSSEKKTLARSILNCYMSLLEADSEKLKAVKTA